MCCPNAKEVPGKKREKRGKERVGQLKKEGKEEGWRGRERIIWSAPKEDIWVCPGTTLFSPGIYPTDLIGASHFLSLACGALTPQMRFPTHKKPPRHRELAQRKLFEPLALPMDSLYK